ncbi:hypothetical protein L6164_008544 [Bauhinia variegata]|uniref:Uncharacterized protein n=1 Tax=Bauhinia variegata TaxID=167791 RepID=A0ACB9PJW1_BAUVA|nr:hypothetical protein L6164_008544 [Bauhinia variegata]
MFLRSGRILSSRQDQAELEERFNINPLFKPDITSEREMATLKQLAEPDLTIQPLAIAYHAIVVPLKLNSGFINLLPKFCGRPGENPYRHINEFMITCSTIQQEGVTEDQVKPRVFPFTLEDAAKDWLYYLMPGSITSWQQLHKMFLENFFLASRIV